MDASYTSQFQGLRGEEMSADANSGHHACPPLYTMYIQWLLSTHYTLACLDSNTAYGSHTYNVWFFLVTLSICVSVYESLPTQLFNNSYWTEKSQGYSLHQSLSSSCLFYSLNSASTFLLLSIFCLDFHNDCANELLTHASTSTTQHFTSESPNATLSSDFITSPHSLTNSEASFQNLY